MTHRVGAGQTLTEGINEGTEEPFSSPDNLDAVILV